MLDGKEIISGGYYNNWAKAALFPKDEKYQKRIQEEMAFMDDVAVQLGVFDQRCFYEAFDIFDEDKADELSSLSCSLNLSFATFRSWVRKL